ncbi:Conserved_hypothetical protein [Hexamita inflata]|uniref:Uncharacterized protein n=1 Tax=Hexamita inflata TaxID=28002 RepID=A0AA86NWL7_9EUKA|nr:Conserved hypothetical protein [Hexamita inflata]
MIPGSSKVFQTTDESYKTLLAGLMRVYDQVQLPTYLSVLFEKEDGNYPLIEQVAFNLTNPCDFQFRILNQPVMLDNQPHFTYLQQSILQDPFYLLRLQPADVCLLLFRRTTAGSLDYPPIITQKRLLHAAQQCNNLKDTRTVLNRAFCKHHHRNANSYWGVVKGSVDQINSYCSNQIHILFEETKWVNWHQFSPGMNVYEIRNQNGWGMRWDFNFGAEGMCAELSFRGLLEPFITDEEKDELFKK